MPSYVVKRTGPVLVSIGPFWAVDDEDAWDAAFRIVETEARNREAWTLICDRSDPADAALDHRSELRYEATEGDRDHERIHAQRWSEGETDAYHAEMQRLRDEVR